MGGTETDSTATSPVPTNDSSTQTPEISTANANVIALLSYKELCALPALLHSPSTLTPRVTLREFDAWLRSLPSGFLISVQPSLKPVRYLVSFEAAAVQRFVQVTDDENAQFNCVDLTSCNTGCSVVRLLELLQPSLALRPDACVTMQLSLMSIPNQPMIRLATTPAAWSSTVMNPYRFDCASDALQMLVDVINKLDASKTTRDVRECVMLKLAIDARATYKLATDAHATYPVGSDVAAVLAEERISRVDALYRVGDCWFTGVSLTNALPRLTQHGGWSRLFRAAHVATGKATGTYYECILDAAQMNENFGPVTSIVDRLLQQHAANASSCSAAH
ncbi:Hypothetical protein UVM_LOCUS123 [uncultured virus]|nr:Hypothetical protein UVM_LOCUS123 [uncultured virus]